MASEGGDEGRPAGAAIILNDAEVGNAIRLLTAASGAGCLAFAGYYAVSASAPEALIVAAFLLCGLILLVLSLTASDSTTPPS